MRTAAKVYIGGGEALEATAFRKRVGRTDGFGSSLGTLAMKKLAIFAVAVVSMLLLTKLANQAPPEPPPGTTFSLKAVKVVRCTPDAITLVDMQQTVTKLEKDDSWPQCSEFPFGQEMDLYLSRGEKTRLLSREKSSWWRKAM